MERVKEPCSVNDWFDKINELVDAVSELQNKEKVEDLMWHRENAVKALVYAQDAEEYGRYMNLISYYGRQISDLQKPKCAFKKALEDAMEAIGNAGRGEKIPGIICKQDVKSQFFGESVTNTAETKEPEMKLYFISCCCAHPSMVVAKNEKDALEQCGDYYDGVHVEIDELDEIDGYRIKLEKIED